MGMTERISSDELIFEQLSEGNLPSEFYCGDKELDEFLRDDALDHQNATVAMTTLVRYKGEIVAYYSLAADCISLDKKEKRRIREEYDIPYTEFPALKICRLAVAESHKKLGIGERMVKDVIGLALDLQDIMGLRFLSVDALKESQGFYTTLGFHINNHEDEVDPRDLTVSMRFDLQPIEWDEQEAGGIAPPDENQGVLPFRDETG